MKEESGGVVFTLYGTSACHLCEQAEAMLLELRHSSGGIEYEKVDISGSDTLFDRYGVRIPVLGHPDGRELGWPFTSTALQAFVNF